MQDLVHSEWLNCTCNLTDHIVKVSVLDWGEDEPPEVCLEMHLRPAPLLRRLLYAVRFVLGSTLRHSCFAEVLLGADECRRLRSLLDGRDAKDRTLALPTTTGTAPLG